MASWSRKRVETVLLAFLSLLSVVPLRFASEPTLWFFGEMLAIVVVTSLAFVQRRRIRHAAAVCLPVIPMVFAALARWLSSSIAFEMTALTAFAGIAISFAAFGRSDRSRGLSLVSSGFLVLFCASIMEREYAVGFPLVWLLGCVWHLVANHWERLDLAMPESVNRHWRLRPTIMLGVLGLFLVGGYSVKDRFDSNRQRTMGIMPTSGGSKWSDPAARSGVGAGEAAIAAQDRAESFGAVDSEIFLESKEPSLFDMVNDMIGEPKQRKVKLDRRQAMTNENVIQAHERQAKSEKGGDSFSTDREPPKEHRHFDDAVDQGVIQWDGPTGIRLAMHRYDSFDGVDWTQSADRSAEKLSRRDLGSNAWFFDPRDERSTRQQQLRGPEADVSVGLCKVLRLDSTRLPVPMMTRAVHIKDVDRADFFAIDRDGCLFMPGREKVPPLTVLHVASERLTEDHIRDGLSAGLPDVAEEGIRWGEIPELKKLIDPILLRHDEPYDQLDAIVQCLRSDFIFDRSSEAETGNPLAHFLRSRRGGDHLFATAAAVMARVIGLESRLVTGFYVRPDAFDFAAGHSSILPEDVHVWAEVKLADGRWFEIEPTPGYVEPHYGASLWLTSRQWLARHWASGVVSFGMATTLFLSRRLWIEWLLRLFWQFAFLLRPRGRMRLAMRIVEVRAAMAGLRRPPGRTQRQWLEDLFGREASLQQTVIQFCEVADGLFFSSRAPQATESASKLVRLLNPQTIHRLSEQTKS